jgi:Trk K+ transport system NAD-binding subunit
MGEMRKFLSQKQYFLLNTLVSSEYAGKKMTDVDFADYASQKLAFRVTKAHVAAARGVFDIPSGRAVAIATKKHTVESLFELIKELEARVAVLEKYCSPSY